MIGNIIIGIGIGVVLAALAALPVYAANKGKARRAYERYEQVKGMADTLIALLRGIQLEPAMGRKAAAAGSGISCPEGGVGRAMELIWEWVVKGKVQEALSMVDRLIRGQQTYAWYWDLKGNKDAVAQATAVIAALTDFRLRVLTYEP